MTISFLPTSASTLITQNLIELPSILCRTQPTLSGKQKRQLHEKLEYVQEVVKTKKVFHCCQLRVRDTGDKMDIIVLNLVPPPPHTEKAV